LQLEKEQHKKKLNLLKLLQEKHKLKPKQKHQQKLQPNQLKLKLKLQLPKLLNKLPKQRKNDYNENKLNNLYLINIFL